MAPAVSAYAVAYGGLLLSPATLMLINIRFEEGPPRTRALAVWGASGSGGLAAGALLGGVLTQAWGWASVLFVLVPLARLTLFAGMAVNGAGMVMLAAAMSSGASYWALLPGVVVWGVGGGVTFPAMFVCAAFRLPRDRSRVTAMG
ncbi:hypothetical protein [Nonomuraea typhae]|uniref:MFS transporter n=1 Tax=Nonomuraea typhae TaxID=2603600 RepID=A0ABW7Z134_9ACTN